MAIRQISNDLFSMRKSAIVSLMHNKNFDDAETCHRYCPKNTCSWCKNWKDILTEKNTYKDHVNLPVAINEEVGLIFKDLSSEALLLKCLDGQTKNNNELLNALI